MIKIVNQTEIAEKIEILIEITIEIPIEIPIGTPIEIPLETPLEIPIESEIQTEIGIPKIKIQEIEIKNEIEENVTESLIVKTVRMTVKKKDQIAINPIATTTENVVLVEIPPILRHRTAQKKRNDLIPRITRKENDLKEKKLLHMKKNLNMTI
jgi:hypothetical protein